MTVRLFIIGSVLASIISWAVWVAIVGYLDPVRAGWIGYTLFFMAFFLAVASTVTMIGYLVRRIVAPQQLAAYAVRSAMRQGVLVGMFIELLLGMQLARLYQWWLAVIIIILFLVIEAVFYSYDRVTGGRS